MLLGCAVESVPHTNNVRVVIHTPDYARVYTVIRVTYSSGQPLPDTFFVQQLTEPLAGFYIPDWLPPGQRVESAMTTWLNAIDSSRHFRVKLETIVITRADTVIRGRGRG